MDETNEELVNTLTLAAATILGSLIQAKLTAQHNLADAIERASEAALQLREKIQQTL
jgi:leucyl aminopeptidase